MTVEMIKEKIKNKLEPFKKCQIYFLKKGDKETSSVYLGEIAALEWLLEEIENTELEELYDGKN